MSNSSYSKIPAETRSTRLAKLEKAGKASNEKRVKALERQAEVAKQAAALLQQSLDESEELLGSHCLPLSNAVKTLEEFATQDLAHRLTAVKRAAQEPVEFYSWVGGGVAIQKAIEAYLAGKEVTAQLKEQLAAVGIDPTLL